MPYTYNEKPGETIIDKVSTEELITSRFRDGKARKTIKKEVAEFLQGKTKVRKIIVRDKNGTIIKIVLGDMSGQ